MSGGSRGASLYSSVREAKAGKPEFEARMVCRVSSSKIKQKCKTPGCTLSAAEVYTVTGLLHRVTPVIQGLAQSERKLSTRLIWDLHLHRSVNREVRLEQLKHKKQINDTDAGKPNQNHVCTQCSGCCAPEGKTDTDQESSGAPHWG